MSGHRAVIEAGPGDIRRICCAAGISGKVADSALAAIDDDVALVGERPVAVASLWSTTLRTLASGHPDGVVVVHPSWWSAARIGVVTTAAGTLGVDAQTHPRSWLLAQALPDAADAAVIEIADQLVAVTGTTVAAVPRPAGPGQVLELIDHTSAVVLIDAPNTIAGAQPLASAIADAVQQTVVVVDDARLTRLARRAGAIPPTKPAEAPPPRSVARVGAGVVLAALALAVPALAAAHHSRPSQPHPAPNSVLVEGRVALTVPADWSAQRVVAGPGSARVQVTSPDDPEVALHVTQSQVPGETLAGTAERLNRAIDAAPAGVFVDFRPSDISAGRPAVTYREVRVDHHVRWTVLLDGDVRISIGCQSRPGASHAVRAACEQAVGSAHAVN
ncbi:type VII secretion-associated protein [Mycobacterium kubicae]|uniref:type VII secretion-associated protein n=1 Tax=Mycobacterium kubicae TaxID=120959 RepID=UPI0007FE5C36|nr:type VII secretion-associated protein [Mycobacterium kubicae]OBK52455.1 type VII secretion-associated protein [Mycobacterium kubicae]